MTREAGRHGGCRERAAARADQHDAARGSRLERVDDLAGIGDVLGAEPPVVGHAARLIGWCVDGGREQPLLGEEGRAAHEEIVPELHAVVFHAEVASAPAAREEQDGGRRRLGGRDEEDAHGDAIPGGNLDDLGRRHSRRRRRGQRRRQESR